MRSEILEATGPGMFVIFFGPLLHTVRVHPNVIPLLCAAAVQSISSRTRRAGGLGLRCVQPTTAGRGEATVKEKASVAAAVVWYFDQSDRTAEIAEPYSSGSG